ncbi:MULTISPECIES: TetR/AcrR family transcriptional regulator [unclassified Pseudarthrobacter]|uniref:TetR/AcrR family transcriptional regulator n=1 Tax=unclassified Pseudarthrobacter TaxID=2647000 RepID=UPI00249C74BE|nr:MULTISPECIES: TetR/AcrR family transcriptional regulator [unclassified Pseudarthrobacter]MDI3195251.1 TetR/AcrR family transcriptional regulator [Pseudarthrobacter sp. AL20]MDI3209317.1 TetR/AcrR family transcriptional regulator [Pseudarthrobacter sp. AL07]
MTDSGDAKGSQERRNAILEAAWQLIAERGYHHVRVQDIARICGTSTGTIHYYFPGKDDVLREALRYCVDQAFDRQGAVLSQIDNAHKRLLALIELQLPIGTQVRNEWSIWLQFWSETCLNPSLRPIHNDFYARWMDAVVSIVRRGQRQGIFRDLDPVGFARLLTSATDGAAIKILTGAPDMSIDGMRTMLVSIVDRELTLSASVA